MKSQHVGFSVLISPIVFSKQTTFCWRVKNLLASVWLREEKVTQFFLSGKSCWSSLPLSDQCILLLSSQIWVMIPFNFAINSWLTIWMVHNILWFFIFFYNCTTFMCISIYQFFFISNPQLRVYIMHAVVGKNYHLWGYWCNFMSLTTLGQKSSMYQRDFGLSCNWCNECSPWYRFSLLPYRNGQMSGWYGIPKTTMISKMSWSELTEYGFPN